MNFQRNRAAGTHEGSEWEMENYGSGERSNEPYTMIPITSAGFEYHHNSNASLDHDRPSRARTETSAASLILHHDLPDNTHQRDAILSTYGKSERRFHFRTLVGVLGPLIVMSYLLVIWRYYLAPTASNSPTAFGPTGARWVFYSWFVAGVVGLGLSRYGLAGAEAGMISHPRWKVRDRIQLMLHADATWSGVSGWVEAGKWMVRMRREKSTHSAFPGRLWIILALPTFIVLIAWLLSALCIEMASGFHHGVLGEADVVGFVYADFNANAGGRKPSRGSYPIARVPGFGAVYTPESVDRSKVEFLQAVPVVLPDSEGVEEIFITAQSETPIEGRAWGLLAHYDCSVVEKQSDLRLLKDRRPAADIWLLGSSVEPDPIPVQKMLAKKQVIWTPTSTMFNKPTPTPSPGPEDDVPPAFHFGNQYSIKYMSYRLHDNATLVEVRKEPRAEWNGVVDMEGEDKASNIDAVIEIAYESWPIPDTNESENACSLPSDSTDNPATSYCYYDANAATTERYPGIDRKRVFEVLLWQGIQAQGGWGNSQFNASLYNLTVDHNITELYGQYTGLNTGFTTGEGSDFESQGEGLTAIGVSCTSCSSVGTADIDGVRSTYSNFISTDSPIPARKGDCARRFGAETLACTLDLNRTEVIRWLFDSIGAPPPLDRSDSDNLLGHGDWRENAQLAYLQASQLRQSLLQAFSNYAIRLMYNDGRDFVGADGSHMRTLNPNITAFVAGRVIASGIMPPGIPVALFGCWTLITSFLCLLYGFRRRCSAVLDTEMVLKLGAELEIPGFGDGVDHSNPSGRTGLVGDQVNNDTANKGKLSR